MRLKTVLSTVSLIVLAGCGGETEVAAPIDPWDISSSRAPCPDGWVCLEAGNGSEPLALDPHKTQGTWESRIVSDLLVGLTDSDIDGTPIPGMATDWEYSEDGLVWTFHLRRDAIWSDGEPVTAHDFEFSLRRIMTPSTASEYAYLLYLIKNAQAVNLGEMEPEELGVRAVDDYTFEITLEHPAPYLPELAKHQTMSPVPRHVLERLEAEGKDPSTWSQPGTYVSNGPYTLVSWRAGDKVVLEKNPNFWGAGDVCIDRVSFYPTPDRNQAIRQVENGELDLQTPLPPNQIPRLRDLAGMADYVHTSVWLGNGYLPLNTATPEMSDRRVRQALSMAVDRDFIVKGIYRDTGYEPAYTFVPPGIANYTPPEPPEWANWPLERRQEEARRLLAEAGYDESNPLRFTVKHRALEAAAQLASIQNDWRQIGVIAQLRGSETQIAYQNMRMKDFTVGDAGWIADYNDPINFLELLHSDTVSMNYGNYNNPEYDRLLDLSNNEPDIEKRAEYLSQAEAIMLNDAPVIPLFFQINTNTVSPRVTGFVDNVVDIHPTRFMCIQEDRPS